MYSYMAKVVRWIDGDTVILKVDLGFRMSFTDAFRLMGIDTPERGEEGWAEAKMEAERLAPVGSSAVVWTHKSDKYGRWLATIHPDELIDTVNFHLLASGHAVSYPAAKPTTKGTP